MTDTALMISDGKFVCAIGDNKCHGSIEGNSIFFERGNLDDDTFLDEVIGMLKSAKAVDSSRAMMAVMPIKSL